MIFGRMSHDVALACAQIANNAQHSIYSVRKQPGMDIAYKIYSSVWEGLPLCVCGLQRQFWNPTVSHRPISFPSRFEPTATADARERARWLTA